MAEGLYRYCYDAMATTFEVLLPARDLEESYASQAAGAVYQEIERLEEELSRFRASSDIYRLGLLKAGDSMRVGLAAWDCLSLAKAVHQETQGAFDVTVGPLMRLWRTRDGTPRTPSAEEIASVRALTGSQLFEMDEDSLSVTVHAAPMAFDLGGIGKGYALDQAVTVLEQWGIQHALLNAGDSTLLALGDGTDGPGWPLRLHPESPPIRLSNRAVSGSGFLQQGEHIMDPRTLQPVPIDDQRRYAEGPTAALTDALSTAFTVMSAEERTAFLARYADITFH